MLSATIPARESMGLAAGQVVGRLVRAPETFVLDRAVAVDMEDRILLTVDAVLVCRVGEFVEDVVWDDSNIEQDAVGDHVMDSD